MRQIISYAYTTFLIRESFLLMTKIFYQKHRHHLGLWLILVLITAISGYYAFSNNPKNDTKNISPPIQTNPTSTVDIQIINPFDNSLKIKSETSQTNQSNPIRSNEPATSSIINSQPSASSDPKSILAVLYINDQKLETKIKSAATVFDLMNQLQIDGKLTFSGKEFGAGLGFFVESINNLKNNDQKNYYWTYYINDIEAPVGISTYKLKSNDIISWKYETR